MDSASRLLCMLGVPNRSSSAAEGELSYALSIAHIEILYCSTMKHILEIILAFLTGLYCCHCAGAVALEGTYGQHTA